ncbi:Uncharacterised protein [Serratia fonticola]|nr:Uncharacterised protein [Serratia fonticola]
MNNVPELKHSFDQIIFSPVDRTLRQANSVWKLRPKEAAVLELLCMNPHKIISHAEFEKKSGLADVYPDKI